MRPTIAWHIQNNIDALTNAGYDHLCTKYMLSVFEFIDPMYKAHSPDACVNASLDRFNNLVMHQSGKNKDSHQDIEASWDQLCSIERKFATDHKQILDKIAGWRLALSKQANKSRVITGSVKRPPYSENSLPLTHGGYGADDEEGGGGAGEEETTSAWDRAGYDFRPPGYTYKQATHFNTVMAPYTSGNKLSVEQIPKELLDRITHRVKRSLTKLTPQEMHALLREMGLKTCYPFHVELTAHFDPHFSMQHLLGCEMQDRLRAMFHQATANHTSNGGRKNFISYPYVLRKLLEIIAFQEQDGTLAAEEAKFVLSIMPWRKDARKTAELDAMWRQICEKTQWKFIQSDIMS